MQIFTKSDVVLSDIFLRSYNMYSSGRDSKATRPLLNIWVSARSTMLTWFPRSVITGAFSIFPEFLLTRNLLQIIHLQFMMANGALVRVLIHTSVTKYLNFKAVDGSFVYNNGKVWIWYSYVMQLSNIGAFSELLSHLYLFGDTDRSTKFLQLMSRPWNLI